MRFIIATVGVLVLSTVVSTQTESRIEGTMANARGPLVGVEILEFICEHNRMEHYVTH